MPRPGVGGSPGRSILSDHRSVKMPRIKGLLCVCLLAASVSTIADEAEAVREVIRGFSLRESRVVSRDMAGWRKPKKVVVYGNESRMQNLQKAFAGIEFTSGETTEAIREAMRDADVYIGWCSPELFEEPSSVHWVHSLSVGVENCVSSEGFVASKKILTNSQRLSGPSIAEHAITMMLMLVRGFDQYAAIKRTREWDAPILPGQDAVWEINGKTLLVVGLGGIGTETARRGHGLGMNVIATRNSRREGPDYVSYVGLADELLTLTARADVIISTVPLTPKTTGMFDQDFFKTMKKTAYFINIARGKSVVTDDLIEALNEGELAGAGLDVTDPEPLPADHPLWDQPRVIITPHVAHRSELLRDRIWLVAQENLRRYVAGEKLLSQVNVERGY